VSASTFSGAIRRACGRRSPWRAWSCHALDDRDRDPGRRRSGAQAASADPGLHARGEILTRRKRAERVGDADVVIVDREAAGRERNDGEIGGADGQRLADLRQQQSGLPPLWVATNVAGLAVYPCAGGLAGGCPGRSADATGDRDRTANRSPMLGARMSRERVSAQQQVVEQAHRCRRPSRSRCRRWCYSPNSAPRR
jgi:hypothetical protein